MANNLEVSITANIADFQEKLRTAQSNLAEAQAAMKSFNAEVQASGGANTYALGKYKEAANAVAEYTGEVAVARAGIAASTAAYVEGAAATEKLSFATSGATVEFVRIGHEAMTGNFSRIPGSLVVLATRMGGLHTIMQMLGGSTLPVIGAIGALAVGFYELEKAAFAAESRLTAIDDEMTLLGRGAQFSGEAVGKEIEGLSTRFNIGKSAADIYVAAVNKIPVATDETRSSVAELGPAFSQLSQQAPEKAIDELVKAFSGGPSEIDNFGSKLNLFTPDQIRAMEAAKASNDTLGAQAILLKALQDRLGPTTTALENLATVQERVGANRFGGGFLEKSLGNAPLPTLGPAATPPSAQAASAADIQAQEIADKYLQTMIAREGVLREIAVLQKAAADTTDASKQAELQTAITEAEQKRLSLENQMTQPLVQAARTQIDQIKATMQAGSTAEIQAEIAKWDEVIATAKSKGLESTDAERARLQLIAQLHQAGTREAVSAGKDQIEAAREAAATIGSDENLTHAQQLAAQRDVWAQLLHGDTLNKSQRVQAEIEYQHAVAAIQKDAKTTKDEIDKSHLSTAIEINKLQLNAKKAELDEEVAAHLITAQQKIEIEKGLVAALAQDDIEELQNEQSGLDEQSVEYQRLADRIKVIRAQLNVDLAALGKQATLQSNKDDQEQALAWRDAMNEMGTASENLVRDIFGGRKTLIQSLQSMTQQFVQSEIASDLKYLTLKLAYGAIGHADDVKNLQGGLLMTILTEQQKTAAVATGAAERSAAESSASSGGLLGMLGDAIKWIGMEAAKVFAGVFAFLSPELGPAAAAPAAASEAAVLATTGPLMAFAQGAWQLPYDTLGIVHAGETIMPESFASGFRSAVSGDGSGDGGSITHNNFITIQAIDTRGMERLLKDNGRVLARIVSDQMNRNIGQRPGF